VAVVGELRQLSHEHHEDLLDKVGGVLLLEF
jgi:hypothetical protein